MARRSGHTIGQVFVGSVAIPIGNQTQLILYDTELAAHENVTPHLDAGPTMIGNTIPANLMRPPAFPYWVAQLNASAVGHAQNGWVGQEAPHPAGLGFKAAEQSGAFRQSGKEITKVVAEPVVEGALLDVFHGKEHTDGDQFADGKFITAGLTLTKSV